jgi:hypothetical protein
MICTGLFPLAVPAQLAHRDPEPLRHRPTAAASAAATSSGTNL